MSKRMLWLAVLVMMFLGTATASTMCRDRLDCQESYNDLSCCIQCEAYACEEAWSTDRWYEFEYQACWNQYRLCTNMGGTHEWCKFAVLDPCLAPVLDDHQDACQEIESRKSSCQSSCAGICWN